MLGWNGRGSLFYLGHCRSPQHSGCPTCEPSSTEAASGAGSRRLLLAAAGVMAVIRVAVLQALHAVGACFGAAQPPKPWAG